ncbi:hypothetical protein [Tsukamurella soli]
MSIREKIRPCVRRPVPLAAASAGVGAVIALSIAAFLPQSTAPAAAPVAASTSPGEHDAVPDPAAFLAAAPPDQPYLGWAIQHHQPYIFLAHNGAGRTCMTWVLQSDGQVFGFAGGGPYRIGLLPAQRLTDIPQAQWAETLRCTMPDSWISIAPIPASEMPHPSAGLQPGDPVPTAPVPQG